MSYPYWALLTLLWDPILGGGYVQAGDPHSEPQGEESRTMALRNLFVKKKKLDLHVIFCI